MGNALGRSSGSWGTRRDGSPVAAQEQRVPGVTVAHAGETVSRPGNTYSPLLPSARFPLSAFRSPL
jgi:hypothetical protein